MNSFLFYDIETSGLSPVFDQILTFAAIRTDERLEELERIRFTIRLRPDVVPSPGAFITHRLRLDELAEGMGEYDAACAIHRAVNRPGTISIGYNSLGFDDQFLRFAFYRNLLDPYTHQYADGCGRMDLLPVALLYRIFKPGDLSWPLAEGRPSMKLERISRDNQLVSSGRAHEAMTDVEATLALARRLAQDASMWDFCRKYFEPGRETQRIQRLGTRRLGHLGELPLGLMVSVAFGADAGYMVPVLGLGTSRVYRNQSLWLRLDASPMSRETLETSQPDDPVSGEGAVVVIRKKNGDEKILLPWLDRFAGRLNSAQVTVADQNLALIAACPDAAWMERYLDYRYPHVPNLDVDASLYQDGFFSRREKDEISRFHKAFPQKGPAVLDAVKIPRIRELAVRILFRNSEEAALYETLLTYGFDSRDHMERVCAGKDHKRPILGMTGRPAGSIRDAGQALTQLLSEGGLDRDQVDILRDLAGYLDGILEASGRKQP